MCDGSSGGEFGLSSDDDASGSSGVNHTAANDTQQQHTQHTLDVSWHTMTDDAGMSGEGV